MREHLYFLDTSSAVVKITAWIFLFFGVVGGIGMFFGLVPSEPRWKGLVVLAVFFFLFCLLYLIAKIADMLAKIINEIKKE